jgi:hypothetical protein
MIYDSGLIAWLRGLRDRRPKNQIDVSAADDKHFSEMASTEGLVRLIPMTNYLAHSNSKYTVAVELTPLGTQALEENP